MRRKLVIFTILLATAFFALPGSSYAADKRSNERTAVTEYSGGQDWRWQRQRRRGRNRNRSWVNTHGYRNYGQYRRTQVGNRRYRTVQRYYWNDGRRYTRRVRVFY